MGGARRCGLDGIWQGCADPSSPLCGLALQGKEGEENPKSPTTAALLEVRFATRLLLLSLPWPLRQQRTVPASECRACRAHSTHPLCLPVPLPVLQENLSDDEEEYQVRPAADRAAAPRPR